MIIDCHAHLVPQSWYHPKSPKSIFDLDALFREQEEAGVDITVFGNNWIRSPEGADTAASGSGIQRARRRTHRETSQTLTRARLFGALRQRQDSKGNREGDSRV